MRRRSPLLAAVVAGVLAVSAGCGDPDPAGPGSDSGQYAGMRDGLGALIDFRASDARTVLIRGALHGRRDAVAVAAIVNRTDHLIPIPTFTAHRVSGLSTVLVRADRDPAAREAGVPEAGSYVPAKGALTVYLLLPGSSRDVTTVGMRTGIEREVRLTPQPADGGRLR